MPDINTKGRAQELYEHLSIDRDPFLRRARLCAHYTIPGLMPPDGHNGSSELYRPHQSIGAMGVNNLAAKFVLTLFPPTRKFFRLVPTEEVAQDLNPEAKTEIEAGLVKVEELVVKRFEALGARSALYEATRHLVIAGNVLVHVGKKNHKVFPLHQYVVRRDGEGELLEFLVKECVALETLPDEVKVLVRSKVDDKTDEVDLYTHVFREEGVWKVYQEAQGHKFNESTYGRKRLPWLALRWSRIDGENYGRSHCDDYLGDLLAAEGLSRSIIRLALVSARIVFLRNPNAMLNAKDFAEANEGDVIDGLKDDIVAAGVEKFPDFQVARTTLEDVLSRLRAAFLMNSAVRRDAERVTAEEIRALIQELQDTFGGVYAVLSQELQLPEIEIIMAEMERDNVIPTAIGKNVRPQVITGIDALGRSQELVRLDSFIAGINEALGPDAMMYVKKSEYLARRAAALDLVVDGLLFSEEEIAAQRQQMAQMQLAERAAPNLVKAVGDHINHA